MSDDTSSHVRVSHLYDELSLLLSSMGHVGIGSFRIGLIHFIVKWHKRSQNQALVLLGLVLFASLMVICNWCLGFVLSGFCASQATGKEIGSKMHYNVLSGTLYPTITITLLL